MQEGVKEVDMVHTFKTDFDFVFCILCLIIRFQRSRFDEQVERGARSCTKVSKNSPRCIHLKPILILHFVFNATIPKKSTRCNWCIGDFKEVDMVHT